MVFFGNGDNFHTSWRPLLLQEKLAVGYLEELRLGQNCGCPHLISPHESWKAFETIQIEMRLYGLIFARCFSQWKDLLVRCHFTLTVWFSLQENCLGVVLLSLFHELQNQEKICHLGMGIWEAAQGGSSQGSGLSDFIFCPFSLVMTYCMCCVMAFKYILNVSQNKIWG